MLSRRLLALPALAALALSTAPASAAPKPQIVDAPNDANGSANVPIGLTVGPASTDSLNAIPTNQAYADVLSVLWQPKKTTKKVGKKTVTTVTGFTVTTTLAAPPTPPNGTQIVYRMLGSTAQCGFFGVVYYSSKSHDPGIPMQSALRDNCVNETTRLTPLADPVISGNTMTWTVPLSVIPRDTKVKLGSKIVSLWFEVRELEDFQGQCLPKDPIPAPPTIPVIDFPVPDYRGICGLAAGVLDNSPTDSDASFTIK